MPVVRSLKLSVQERDLGRGKLLMSSFLKSLVTEDNSQNHHPLPPRKLSAIQLEK